jgi:hypothetical protein
VFAVVEFVLIVSMLAVLVGSFASFVTRTSVPCEFRPGYIRNSDPAAAMPTAMAAIMKIASFAMPPTSCKLEIKS